METKAEWRAWAKSLPPATTDESNAVAAHVSEFIARKGWRVVMTFLAMPGEVDLGSVKDGLELVVTRTPPNGPLTIHRLTDDLETHAFGYHQPRENAPSIDRASIEVVLVPGVLFGLDGSRLGHGKGYYDNLLTSFDQRPYLLGVTLRRRIVDGVPMTSTDVYMDAVVTENGVSLASFSSR